MKHIIAILLLSLFFLQVVPVLRLFTAGNNVSCSFMDEKKPVEVKEKEKKEINEYLSARADAVKHNTQLVQYHNPLVLALHAPYLESFTPPPYCTC